MRKAGVDDYRNFALDVLKIVTDRPVSFEVFADELPLMEAQALEIASWGRNVNVKIPVTNTRGDSTAVLVRRLSAQGVAVNVTAMFTLDQVNEFVEVLHPDTPAILSVFAGRIADAGVDPVPIMAEAVEIMRAKPRAELLWASPREVLNVVQADEIGCHIITITDDLVRKLPTLGKDLLTFSRETVAMFHRDASSARYAIEVAASAAE